MWHHWLHDMSVNAELIENLSVLTRLFLFYYSFWLLFCHASVWDTSQQWEFIWTGIIHLLTYFFINRGTCEQYCLKSENNSSPSLDSLYNLHFSCSSSHHLVGVCLVQVQPIQRAQLLVEGFSVVWEVNRVKTLLIRTHSAPLPTLEGLGSLLRQVGLCNLQQNK